MNFNNNNNIFFYLKSIQNIANGLRRHNSWDTQPNTANKTTPKGSADNATKLTPKLVE